MSEPSLWLFSVPVKDKNDTSPLQQLESKTRGDKLSVNSAFKIPDLKVGTMDALMSLSDDLAKIDAFIEAVVKKILKLWFDELKEKAALTCDDGVET
jgi:V-type H+-transporting ATPase subunit C